MGQGFGREGKFALCSLDHPQKFEPIRPPKRVASLFGDCQGTGYVKLGVTPLLELDVDLGEVRLQECLRMEILPVSRDLEAAQEVLLRFLVLPKVCMEHPRLLRTQDIPSSKSPSSNWRKLAR